MLSKSNGGSYRWPKTIHVILMIPVRVTYILYRRKDRLREKKRHTQTGRQRDPNRVRKRWTGKE